MKDFINTLREKNIHVSLQDSNLKIKFDGEIPQELLLELKSRKQELITFLQNHASSENQIPLIPIAEKADDYSASSLQSSIWAIHSAYKEFPIFNISEKFLLEGNLEVDLFENAILKVIDRHEILRTNFILDTDENVRLQIRELSNHKFKLIYKECPDNYDISKDSEDDIPLFDLTSDSLFKCYITKYADNRYVLRFVIHHIICDGWSLNILIKEILDFYHGFVNQTPTDISPLPIQFKDFSEWQQTSLKNGEYDVHKTFWQEKLKEETEVLDLPALKKRPGFKTYEGSILKFTFPEETHKKMVQLSSQHRTTLFSTLITSLSILFYKYTNKTDITLGTVVMGRENTQLDSLIGLFVNVMIVRNKFSPDANFKQLVQNVSSDVMEAFQHQKYPFNEIVKNIKTKRNKNRSPFFDVQVLLQNQNKLSKKSSTDDTLKIETITSGLHTTSQYDLTFEFFEGENLDLTVEYNTDIYDETIITNMFRHFNTLIDDISANTAKPLTELGYIDEKEKELLINTYGSTEEGNIYIVSEDFSLCPIGKDGKIFILPVQEKEQFKEVSDLRILQEELLNTEIWGKWIDEHTIRYKTQEGREKTVSKTEFIKNYYRQKDRKNASIIASFTADNLYDSLEWTLNKFQLNYNINMAPYHQVFQELIQYKNYPDKNDVLIILNRLEDYISQSGDEVINNLNYITDTTIQALSDCDQLSVPVIYFIMPLHLSQVPEHVIAPINNCYDRLSTELKKMKNLYVIDLRSSSSMEIFDDLTYRQAKIPFTDRFIFKLTENIARTLYLIENNTPFKAIALDCDNTLWEGVCGEDSLEEIKITSGHQYLQNFIVQKQKEGFIITLLSKNNEEDVWNVFDNHPDMILKREHITAYKIDWSPKHENIETLSKELNIGIDSFIFLDDNPVECTKMMEAQPKVLTLEFPGNSSLIQDFINRVVAFDRINLTFEDSIRTKTYQQEIQRNTIKKSMDFDSFLEDLNLELYIDPLQESDIDRISQLTYRTNQFNANGIRRTPHEIQMLVKEGYTCYSISASDRFGEYGTVGMILLSFENNLATVHNFLLSCRVLGRKIEYAITDYLKETLLAQGCHSISFSYKKTLKNRPFLDFLQSISQHDFSNEDISYIPFQDLHADAVKSIRILHREASGTHPKAKESEVVNSISSTIESLDEVGTKWRWKESSLYQKRIFHQHVYDFLEAFDEESFQVLFSQKEEDQNSQNSSLEEWLCKTFEDVLNISPVQPEDDFFDLGGHSLNAVQIISRIHKKCGLEVSMNNFFIKSNIRELSSHIIENIEMKEWVDQFDNSTSEKDYITLNI